jgi:hypothetical protein
VPESTIEDRQETIVEMIVGEEEIGDHMMIAIAVGDTIPVMIIEVEGEVAEDLDHQLGKQSIYV